MDVGRSVCYTETAGILKEIPRHVVRDRRARDFPLLALAVGIAVILLVRRRGVPRVVQIALVAGGAEWIRTTVALASARAAVGQSWIRLAAILGAVALFTMYSGLVFKLPRLRERYGA